MDYSKLAEGVKKDVQSANDRKKRKLAAEERAVGAAALPAPSAPEPRLDSSPVSSRRGKRIRKTNRRTFTFQTVDDERLARAQDRAADAGARPTPDKTAVVRMGLLALDDLKDAQLLELYQRIEKPEPEFQ